MQREADSLQERPRYPVIGSGIAGLGLMGAIGAIEGAVTGMMMAAFMERSSDMVMMGVMGASVAMVIGALIGLICFIIAGEICQDMPDFREAMKSVRGGAIRGSVIGMALGGVMGMAAQRMFYNHDVLDLGYTIGVILGTTVGTLIGGITVAAREAYAPTDTPPTQHDTMQHDATSRTSITISL